MIELHPEFLTKNGQKQFAILPYEEFLKIKELLEDAKESPKDKSKLDILINRVQNVLDKYIKKLNSITISFENLGVKKSRKK
jgi:hypothetical protein